jgi:hypothetical protein
VLTAKDKMNNELIQECLLPFGKVIATVNQQLKKPAEGLSRPIK